MPETKKTTESPQTPGGQPDDTTGLGADVKAAKEAALKDARSTVTKAGKVMDIVEQGELTESRRSALEVLKEKLTGLQARTDRTEGVADEIEKTLSRINKKVEQEETLKTDIALAEAQKYMTNPTAWNEFVGYAKGVLRRQEYLGNDAAAHAEDTTLKSLNTKRLSAIDAYSKSTPKAPANWQPDRENQARMLGALQALATLEDITEKYEQYRGVVDGIRALGGRTFIVPTDSTVTLDVRRNNSQTPNMITLSAVPGTDHTSGTSDLNIKRTESGWEVTMKPDFTGRLYVNRGTTQQGWNKFDIGAPVTRPTEKPKQAAPTPEKTRQFAPVAPDVTPAPTQTPKPAVTKKPEPKVPTPQPKTPAAPKTPSKTPASPQPRTETPQQSAPVKETVPASGEISLQTNRTAFIRQKNSQMYHYLQPNFANVNWTLGNFADAVRSADGSRWIIKPRKGAGALETSVDGKTWTDAIASQAQAPVQKAPNAAPAPKNTAPQAAPVIEKREQVTSTETLQTSPTTLEFPVGDVVNISYKTSKAYSPKPYALRSKVSSLDFYLYTIKKEKGVWKFAMKAGQSGEITIGLPTGDTKTFQLGEGVPFNPPKTTNTPPTKQAPATEPATPNAPEKKTPKKAPTSESKNATTRSASAAPADTAKPKSDSGLSSRSFGGESTEPTRPVAPVNKETVLSSERVDTLFNGYNTLYKEYTETMQKDYATYGGSKEWKLFDQEFSQLLFDVEEPFGGNKPRFLLNVDNWRALVSTTEGKRTIAEALPKMRKLLDEYKTTTFEKNAPTKVQKIDTLTGDTEALKQSIAKYRAIIAAKNGTIPKDFAKLDSVYTDALKLTKKPETQKAILVCHMTLAKNYAEAKAGRSVNPFASAMNLVSDVASFKTGMTENDFRAALVERSERTPVQLKLTPKQLLQLVRMKQRIDVLRMRTDLTEEQRYDELVGIIGDNSAVLESISKESRAQLKSLEALGYSAEVAMKDVFNPETIEWLLAAHLSAVPVTGMSDRAFFYIKPTKESTAEKKSEPTPLIAKAAVTPTPSALPEKDEGIGRELSTAEVEALGFVLNKSKKETVKELEDGSYIACTKTSCRPIKPTKPGVEKSIAATPIVTPPVTKKEVPEKKSEPKTPAAKPTPQPAVAAAEKTAAPEKKNTISAVEREFRLPAKEGFTLTYNPPFGGSSGSSFLPNSPAIQQGLVVKAQRYSDLWVVNILPQYEGTVTLKCTSDNATESLTVKVDKAALAAMERERSKTVQEAMTEAEFTDLVLNSPVPVVVDMYKKGCDPCIKMAPDLAAIAQEGGGAVRIVKFNGEILTNLRNRYAPIQDNQYLYPTLIVFNKGSLVRSVIGLQSKESIRGIIPPPTTEAVTMNP